MAYRSLNWGDLSVRGKCDSESVPPWCSVYAAPCQHLICESRGGSGIGDREEKYRGSHLKSGMVANNPSLVRLFSK